MLNFRIKFDDKKMFKEIIKQSARLQVGFFEGDIYEEIDRPYYASKGILAKRQLNKPRRYGARKAIPVARVAMVQEYGDGWKIPPRPFMRNTVGRARRQWRKLVQDRLPVIMNMKKTAEELGIKMVEDVRKTILDFTTPPNAPSTVARKGFNKPLIDSGQMLNSVKWRVK